MPYISVDLNGHIFAHKQAFDRWYPASLTKMMTAYIAFQALQAGKIKADTVIKISPAAERVVPSLSGWRAGSTLTFDTALTVMMVKSANDMANAIAEAVKGSQSAFVTEMNAQAQRLGMSGTHFANPSGLPDPENYSNARDLAVLAAQLRLEFPQYSHYFDIPAIDFGHGRRPQPNSNYLIGRYSGADGMKTGFICASGFNLVASATRRGRTVIAVVLGAPSINNREETAAKLLSHGFKNAGSPRLTLANLKPYGTKQNDVTNMRQEICNAEAGKLRMQFRDEKGHIIFNSPFISVLNEQPLAIPVRVISEPPRAEPARKRGKTARAKTAKSETANKAAGTTAKQPQIILVPPEAWRVPAPQSRPVAP